MEISTIKHLESDSRGLLALICHLTYQNVQSYCQFIYFHKLTKIDQHVKEVWVQREALSMVSPCQSEKLFNKISHVCSRVRAKHLESNNGILHIQIGFVINNHNNKQLYKQSFELYSNGWALKESMSVELSNTVHKLIIYERSGFTVGIEGNLLSIRDDSLNIVTTIKYQNELPSIKGKNLVDVCFVDGLLIACTDDGKLLGWSMEDYRQVFQMDFSTGQRINEVIMLYSKSIARIPSTAIVFIAFKSGDIEVIELLRDKTVHGRQIRSLKLGKLLATYPSGDPLSDHTFFTAESHRSARPSMDPLILCMVVAPLPLYLIKTPSDRYSSGLYVITSHGITTFHLQNYEMVDFSSWISIFGPQVSVITSASCRHDPSHPSDAPSDGQEGGGTLSVYCLTPMSQHILHCSSSIGNEIGSSNVNEGALKMEEVTHRLDSEEKCDDPRSEDAKERKKWILPTSESMRPSVDDTNPDGKEGKPIPIIGSIYAAHPHEEVSFFATARYLNHLDRLQETTKTFKPLIDLKPSLPSQEKQSTPIRKSKARGDWETPQFDRDGRLVDQPITYHSRIKPSGYGQAATKSLKTIRKGTSRSSFSGLKAPVVDREFRSNTAPSIASTVEHNRLKGYPMDCKPMTLLQRHHSYPIDDSPDTALPPSPNLAVQFSYDASLIAISGSSSCATIVKCPISKHKGSGVDFTGHNGKISNISFSYLTYSVNKTSRRSSSPSNAIRPQPMLLSSSSDGTARLWSRGNRLDHSLITFGHKYHSISDSIQAPSSSNKHTKDHNPPFDEEISDCQFFYQDRFIILSVKNLLFMYSFDAGLDASQSDLNCLASNGSYQSVKEWNFSKQSHSITAMACINSVQSPIIFCCTSDKMVHLLDAGTGSMARSIPSPHDRSIHHISLPSPSVHVAISSEHYNLFTSSSTDNMIALWDVRSPRPIARIQSHVNRREPVRCSISPCLKYIGTGSEDRTARLFDMKMLSEGHGKEIAKLTGHRDVVTSVAFNPLYPQLATSSYDGTIRFYVDPDIDPSHFHR